MASLRVRRLAEDTKARLTARARRHNQCLEAEVRQILDRAAQEPEPADDIEGFPFWFVDGSRLGVDLEPILEELRRSPHSPIAVGKDEP